MPSQESEAGGLASVLKESRVGTFTLSNFVHTTSGRLLRKAGIDVLYADIKKKGWLTIIGDLPDEGLTVDNANTCQYRMVDGNHRLAAIRLLEKDLRLLMSTSTSDYPQLG